MVPKRIASVLINSLKGGVVPRIGLPYITVGRAAEIDTLLHDIAIISEGGSSFRFIVGAYGSGKSFLIQTIRNYAMDKNFVVADADLTPERRLWGNKGQGLATYRELVSNLATKTRPEGGALAVILDRWISSIQNDVIVTEGLPADDPCFPDLVARKIHNVINELHDMVHGVEFARLLSQYYQFGVEDNEEGKNRILRWFKGEYTSKSEVKSALGMSLLINDDNWYDCIKLFAFFLKRAGYAGMLLLLDELVNIWKIPHAITRQYNYEKLLSMYNDILQGKAQHLGILMGATPQCIEDKRRGVFSYEALRSRLEEGRFGKSGVRDMLAPIIRLEPLSHEEMLILVEKLAAIHADLFGYQQIMTEEDLATFIRTESERIGADTHITPREVIRDFIELLNIVQQHPETSAATLMAQDSFVHAKPVEDPEADLFAEFEL